MGIDGRQQCAVEAGHAPFVVEVAGVAQAAHDESGPLLAGKFGDQPGEVHDAHVGQTGQDGLGHVEPFGQGEQGALAAVGHGNDDGLVMGSNALDHVLVAKGQRVEGAGIDDKGHVGCR